MPRNYTYIENRYGNVDMLAFRHASSLPPERQEWGGLAPESIRGTNKVLRTIRALGLIAKDHIVLEDGGSATLIDSGGSLTRLHNHFGYMLRVSPDTGVDIIGAPSDLPETVFGSPSHDEGLNAASWALCVIKPDAKKLGMEQLIADEIQSRGLRVRAALAGIALSQESLDQLWPSPLDSTGAPIPPSEWWSATVAYMTEAPVDIMLVNGDNASLTMKSLKSDLRKSLYGDSYQSDERLSYDERVKSVIHTSDCNRELVTNVAGFWSSSEIEKIVRKE